MLKITNKSIYKALFATFIYVIVAKFYNIEIVRSNAEDIAFDAINRFLIYDKEKNTTSPNVMIFAYDDLYMKKHKLFDEDGNIDYGYVFPRRHLVNFIKKLDNVVENLESDSSPKALFIDYNMVFSTLPYGKELSKDDKLFLEELSKEHKYKIYISKTAKQNFIEFINIPTIQKAIKDGNISIVSVNLKSKDGIVRRYQSWTQFGVMHPTKPYINIDVALWSLVNRYSYNFDYNDKSLYINKSNIKDEFAKEDIIKNRILLKNYKEQLRYGKDCLVESSYWNKLKRYSANCIYEIDDSEFNNSIILLGGTHSQNSDKFDTLNIFSTEKISGIDMHANIIMTLFNFDGQLKTLPIYISVPIIFTSFLLIDLIVISLLRLIKIRNLEITWIVILVANSLTLLFISYYILQNYHLWFNWFVPIVIFYMLDVILMVQEKSPILFLYLYKSFKRKG